MDRPIAQSRPSAQPPPATAIAHDAVLAVVMVAVMALLAISVGLLASIAHGA
jgi:hypothetical protein